MHKSNRPNNPYMAYFLNTYLELKTLNPTFKWPTKDHPLPSIRLKSIIVSVFLPPGTSQAGGGAKGFCQVLGSERTSIVT